MVGSLLEISVDWTCDGHLVVSSSIMDLRVIILPLVDLYGAMDKLDTEESFGSGRSVMSTSWTSMSSDKVICQNLKITMIRACDSNFGVAVNVYNLVEVIFIPMNGLDCFQKLLLRHSDTTFAGWTPLTTKMTLGTLEKVAMNTTAYGHFVTRIHILNL